jgi:hypothetical protein
MIKNVKIWIGKNNEEYSRLVQEYLFSKGVTWNDLTNGTVPIWCKCLPLFVGNDGNLMYGNYDKSVFDSLSSYEEVKLVETVTYSLEEVIVREKIYIGDKEYYKDELEVALKNIKPI